MDLGEICLNDSIVLGTRTLLTVRYRQTSRISNISAGAYGKRSKSCESFGRPNSADLGYNSVRTDQAQIRVRLAGLESRQGANSAVFMILMTSLTD